MSFDFQKLEASKAGEALTLTTREFRLMQLFVERKGDVLSRDEILNQVWGYDVFPTTRTVDNYILRLRKCIEEEPSSPVWLVSVRGAGYRFTG
jgi:two-component system alkaline phosphatase synthesis response regulator PhoP